MNNHILILGGGAVGMAYGKHFADAGNQVTFYVREKYIEALSTGEILYHLNKDKNLDFPIHFQNFDLVTTFDEIATKEWDQIYLCFSSTALQSFDFSTLKNSLIGDPTIVMLQPNAGDYEVLANTFDQNQIVEGMITLISYQAPLATESAEQEGIAYYLPPMMPIPFSGEKERRDHVIETFKKSKLSAKASKSVRMESLFPTAYLMSFLTALESSDWRFQNLKKNKILLKQLKVTINEIFTALEKEYNTKRPISFRFLSGPMLVTTMLTMVPAVMPMDIETYFRYHFTKVKDQTKLYMNNYLELAKSLGLPYNNIEQFCELT